MTAPATVSQLRRAARLLRMLPKHVVLTGGMADEMRTLADALTTLARERSAPKAEREG